MSELRIAVRVADIEILYEQTTLDIITPAATASVGYSGQSDPEVLMTVIGVMASEALTLYKQGFPPR